MRAHLRASLATILFAVGLAVSIWAGSADATTVHLADLPALGYTLGLRGERVGALYCYDYYVLSGNGAPETLLGDPDHADCTAPGLMQQRIDALLVEFPPPGLEPGTVTVTTAVSTPAVTTTVTLAPLPAVTVTETVVETVTETVTVAAPVPDPEWLTALALRSEALNALYGL